MCAYRQPPHRGSVKASRRSADGSWTETTRAKVTPRAERSGAFILHGGPPFAAIDQRLVRILEWFHPGLAAMIGKGERGPAAVEAIRRHKAASLIAVGGAAYLVAKAIRKSRVIAFEDLGMEAIYEFEVQDMPVTVAVDSTGQSVHQSGPAEWSQRIVDLKIPVTAA